MKNDKTSLILSFLGNTVLFICVFMVLATVVTLVIHAQLIHQLSISAPTSRLSLENLTNTERALQAIDTDIFFESLTSGKSMLPTIAPGNIMVIDKTYNSLNVGDIVLFNPKDGKDRIVVHRIVEITPEHIITKGDNNDGNDNPITNNQIIGVVVGIIY